MFWKAIASTFHACELMRYVLNKIDAISMEELDLLGKIPHFVPISAYLKWNLEELFETIYNYLEFIRVYTKPKVSSLGSNSGL